MVIEQDTIAAIATAIGEAGVGIVRVSGPDAKEIALKIFRNAKGERINIGQIRKMAYGMVYDSFREMIIDECILLWMPSPKSYTSEDVVEFQVHGGVKIVQLVLNLILQHGARVAEPGEFTKRAFLNGRLDLSQAEAVIDLIRAKTDKATQYALQQVQGQFGNIIRALRKELLSLQAQVEVTIDYPEHDVESVACSKVIEVGTSVYCQMESLVHSARMGEILREGVATVIVGRPNVGKSSLLNALLRRDRAIVTNIAGTTRDVIEEYVNVRGIPLKLIDTAGIHQTEDIVEQIGVSKSREILHAAELVILVLNGNEVLTDEDHILLNETLNMKRIVVINKSDLPFVDIDEKVLGNDTSPVVRLSAKLSQGLGALEDTIYDLIMSGMERESENSYMVNARQSHLLKSAQVDLLAAIDDAKVGATLDLIAVELQGVYAKLGEVIGEQVGEDLLDEIFSNFCLGK